MTYKKVYVDRKCYESLMDGLNLQQVVDQKGEFTDFDLFYSDDWLLNSAVVDNVIERNGNWDIYLVFAYVGNPLKLIKRRITRCITIKKANLTANYMRRLAAKDQRGTLKIDCSSFKNCDN